MKSHLTQGASTMSIKNVSSLMESICYVCTKQADENALKLALSDICSIPLAFMQQIQLTDLPTVDKSHLLKAVSMIAGALRALQELSEAVLEDTLLPMIQSVWEKLMGLLCTRAPDNDLIATTCNLINRSIGLLAKNVIGPEFFDSLSVNLITCFKSNPQNLCCLQTFALLCLKVGKSSEEMKQRAMMQFNVVCEMVLQRVEQA